SRARPAVRDSADLVPPGRMASERAAPADGFVAWAPAGPAPGWTDRRPRLPRRRRNHLSTTSCHVGRGSGRNAGEGDGMIGSLVRWSILAGAALALAGCETISPLASSPRVAELEDDQSGSQAVNIGSLSEVISRNPND